MLNIMVIHTPSHHSPRDLKQLVSYIINRLIETPAAIVIID